MGILSGKKFLKGLELLTQTGYIIGMREKIYTIKDVVQAINRDRHSAWRYADKFQIGTKVANRYLFTKKELDELVKKIKTRLYNVKKEN
jgi:hypothetical protein